MPAPLPPLCRGHLMAHTCRCPRAACVHDSWQRKQLQGGRAEARRWGHTLDHQSATAADVQWDELRELLPVLLARRLEQATAEGPASTRHLDDEAVHELSQEPQDGVYWLNTATGQQSWSPPEGWTEEVRLVAGTVVEVVLAAVWAHSTTAEPNDTTPEHRHGSSAVHLLAHIGLVPPSWLVRHELEQVWPPRPVDCDHGQGYEEGSERSCGVMGGSSLAERQQSVLHTALLSLCLALYSEPVTGARHNHAVPGPTGASQVQQAPSWLLATDDWSTGLPRFLVDLLARSTLHPATALLAASCLTRLLAHACASLARKPRIALSSVRPSTIEQPERGARMLLHHVHALLPVVSLLHCWRRGMDWAQDGRDTSGESQSHDGGQSGAGCGQVGHTVDTAAVRVWLAFLCVFLHSLAVQSAEGLLYDQSVDDRSVDDSGHNPPHAEYVVGEHCACKAAARVAEVASTHAILADDALVCLGLLHTACVQQEPDDDGRPLPLACLHEQGQGSPALHALVVHGKDGRLAEGLARALVRLSSLAHRASSTAIGHFAPPGPLDLAQLALHLTLVSPPSLPGARPMDVDESLGPLAVVPSQTCLSALLRLACDGLGCRALAMPRTDAVALQQVADREAGYWAHDAPAGSDDPHTGMPGELQGLWSGLAALLARRVEEGSGAGAGDSRGAQSQGEGQVSGSTRVEGCPLPDGAIPGQAASGTTASHTLPDGPALPMPPGPAPAASCARAQPEEAEVDI